MNKLKVLIFVSTVLTISVCQNCENEEISTIVYENVDSVGERVTKQGKIEHDKDIFNLEIFNETIPKLCKNFISIQNELSVLQLKKSDIQEIEEGAFNVTPSLSLIKITLNPLSRVNKNIFNNIKVKEIDLSENRISNIDPEAFDNNTSLQIIKLNSNQIKDLNPSWFFKSDVYKLEMIYNDITNIPPKAFKNLSKNRPLKIRLSANRITEIDPAALEGQDRIEMLRLNGNKLAVLPENIFVNKSIKNLHINANSLKCFPDILFEIKLNRLTFVDNSFECKCLKKVKKYVEDNNVDIVYPSIICEDRTREVNIVFNYNRTYDIPLPVEIDAYVPPDKTT